MQGISCVADWSCLKHCFQSCIRTEYVWRNSLSVRIMCDGLVLKFVSISTKVGKHFCCDWIHLKFERQASISRQNRENISSWWCPDCHVLKSFVCSPKRIEFARRVVSLHLVEDFTPELYIVAATTREENAIKFSELANSSGPGFSRCQRHNSRSGWLNKLNIGGLDVSWIPSKSWVIRHAGVQWLRDNSNYWLLVDVIWGLGYINCKALSGLDCQAKRSWPN